MSSTIDAAVGRHRSLLLALGVLLASAAAGYGIYAGQRKILLLLAVFTATILLRRNTFTDFYLVTIGCALMANMRIGFTEDFDLWKWEALFAMGAVSVAVMVTSLRDVPRLAFEHLAILVFTLLGIWSVSWSLLPAYSFQKVGVFCVIVLVSFGGCWFWARDLPRVQALVDTHLDWVWLVFPVSIAYMVLRPGAAMIAGRLAGPFENPNNIGFWTSTTVPLLFAAALTHPVRWRRWSAGLLAASGIVACLLAASRGGLIGSALGILLYCLARFTKKTLALLALLAIVTGFWRAYQLGIGSLEEGAARVIRADTLEDMADRTYMWELCTLIAKEKIWLGHGFGQGERLLPLYGFENDSSHFGLTVHNTYMEIWMNDGLIGVGLFLLVAGLAGLRGLLTWRKDRHGPRGLLSLGLACTLFASSAHAFVETVFTNPGSPWTLPFWVTVAMLIRLHGLGPETKAAPATAPALSGSLGAGALLQPRPT